MTVKLGDIVIFRPAQTDDDHLTTANLAAIVTKVWSPTCVNLAVFDETGAGARPRTSVRCLEEGDEYPLVGSWALPPGVNLKAPSLDPPADPPPLPEEPVA